MRIQPHKICAGCLMGREVIQQPLARRSPLWKDLPSPPQRTVWRCDIDQRCRQNRTPEQMLCPHWNDMQLYDALTDGMVHDQVIGIKTL